MEEEKAVVVAKKMEVSATAQDNGPMAMMMQAMAQGADVDQIEKMMALQERWDANQAKKAYVKAMAAFKANPPKIIKDKLVSYKATKYSHASLGNVTQSISEGLGAHGLSAAWETIQLDKGMIKVVCIITHEIGHSESTSLSAMPDVSGSKNSIQAIGSTVSYLQRYTILAITGLATQDQDNDGRASQATAKLVDEKQISQLVDCMNEAGVVHADFLKFYANLAKCDILTVEQMPATMFNPAMIDLKGLLAGDK